MAIYKYCPFSHLPSHRSQVIPSKWDRNSWTDEGKEEKRPQSRVRSIHLRYMQMVHKKMPKKKWGNKSDNGICFERKINK